MGAEHGTAQDWIFTFGCGQDLAGRYVVIHGTRESARDEMFAHFGSAWAFQYASREEAGVARWGLTELPRAAWPEVVP